MSNEQNLNVKITGETGDFRKEVDAVARQLADMGNNITAVDKNASKASSSLNGMANSATTTRKATDEMGKTMAHAAEQTGDAAREMQNLKQASFELSDAFVLTKQNAENFRGVLDAIVKGLGTNGASGVMANIKTLMNSTAFQVMILYKALNTFKDAAVKAITLLNKTWEDASDLARNYADVIADGSAATSKIADQTEKYMKRLGELIQTEKLSNVEKMEMSDLLDRLDGGFTHVGKSIDKARGNLKQYDKDMAAFLAKNKRRKLDDIDAQIASLHNALAEEKKIIGVFENRLLAGLTKGLTARFAESARTREAQIQKKINGLLMERNELEEKNPADDYRRRRAAEEADRKAEQLQKKQDARKEAKKALSEASDELDLTEYARKRKAVMKKYADMAKDLKGDPRAMANIARLRAKELAKIDAEELKKRNAEQKRQADAEKTAEKGVATAKKNLLSAEKAQRKAIADARIAQAKRAADEEIRQLERVRKRIDKRMKGFGFKLDVNPNESHAEARRRRRRNSLDESIADKQKKQADGKTVHYSKRERRRIGQYRSLQKKGKKIDNRIKEIEAAKKQQDAAAQAKAAAERIAEAAKGQKEAAKDLKDAALELKKVKSENAEKTGKAPNVTHPQSQPVAPGQRLNGRQQQSQSVTPQRPMAPTAAAASFTPNYTPQLAAILQAVLSLKSNTYIVK